jgi:AcrR family transcriptional regulator
MAKRSIDRRVTRSRTMLHKALMSLILKKDYEAISVQDICDAANIGRSTFYAHYTSKDHLKRAGLDQHLRRLLIHRPKDAPAALGANSGQRLGFSLAMFEHAAGHKDLLRALAGGRGGAIALGTIRQIISDAVRGELAATANKHSAAAVPHDLIVQYVAGAYMAVLTWWLDGGAKLPPQRIDAIFRRLATEGIMPSFS